jgi:hypothetical protein
MPSSVKPPKLIIMINVSSGVANPLHYPRSLSLSLSTTTTITTNTGQTLFMDTVTGQSTSINTISYTL